MFLGKLCPSYFRFIVKEFYIVFPKKLVWKLDQTSTDM